MDQSAFVPCRECGGLGCPVYEVEAAAKDLLRRGKCDSM
jgi:hypothetical protein